MKKMLLGLLATLSMLGLTACGSNKEEVNIFQYVNVTFRGDNDSGIANASFNSLTALGDDKLKDSTVFVSSLKTKVEPNENLKNGDEVKVSIIYDENAYDDVEFKFTETEKTYTVKNLTEYYSANDSLSKEEYQDLGDYILNKGIFQGLDGKNSYASKVNEDGSITNHGVIVNINLDSMYIAENCEDLPSTIPSKNSILTFFKVDYIATEDCDRYEAIDERDRSGTYYTWVEFFDLSKPNEEGERTDKGYQAIENGKIGNLGTGYVNLKRYLRDNPEEIENDTSGYFDIMYGYMNKDEQLQYYSKQRNVTYTELKVSK